MICQTTPIGDMLLDHLDVTVGFVQHDTFTFYEFLFMNKTTMIEDDVCCYLVQYSCDKQKHTIILFWLVNHCMYISSSKINNKHTGK